MFKISCPPHGWRQEGEWGRGTLLYWIAAVVNVDSNKKILKQSLHKLIIWISLQKHAIDFISFYKQQINKRSRAVYQKSVLGTYQIDRQIDRQINRQIDIQIDRQIYRKINRYIETQIDKQIHRKIFIYIDIDILIDRQKDRDIQIDRQIDRNINRQIHRQIDTQRQIDRFIYNQAPPTPTPHLPPQPPPPYPQPPTPTIIYILKMLKILERFQNISSKFLNLSVQNFRKTLTPIYNVFQNDYIPF